MQLEHRMFRLTGHVPGHEHDPELGTHGRQALRKIRTTRSGKDDVGDKQTDLFAATGEDLKGF